MLLIALCAAGCGALAQIPLALHEPLPVPDELSDAQVWRSDRVEKAWNLSFGPFRSRVRGFREDSDQKGWLSVVATSVRRYTLDVTEASDTVASVRCERRVVQRGERGIGFGSESGITTDWQPPRASVSCAIALDPAAHPWQLWIERDESMKLAAALETDSLRYRLHAAGDDSRFGEPRQPDGFFSSRQR